MERHWVYLSAVASYESAKGVAGERLGNMFHLEGSGGIGRAHV